MASYKVEVTCPFCKEKRIITYQKKSINPTKQCQNCYNKNRLIDRKKSVTKAGYLRIGQKYEHRLIWESSFGKIPKGFIIHHKDGDRKNNNLENLELLPKKLMIY